MSTYMLAKGSKFYRKNPTSSTYEEIPQCTVLTGPQIRQDFDEITNHSSPGGFKEFAATLRDGGELPVEVLWDVINIPIHEILYDDSVAEPLPIRLWGIILPNGLFGWGFSGFLTSPSPNLDFTKAIRMGASVRISAQPIKTKTGLAGLP